MKYYTQTNEWIEVEGSLARVGITDRAKEEFQEIVYLELPEVGKVFRREEEIVVLESTKAALDIYTPLSGEVVRVHEALQKNLALIPSLKEEELWLFELKLSSLKELEFLREEILS